MKKEPKLRMMDITLGNKNLVHLAYFDVLGFEKKFEKEGLEGMYEIYKELINLINENTGKHGYFVDEHEDLGELYEQNKAFFTALNNGFWATTKVSSYYSSDSILLWMPWHHKTAKLFCDVCIKFFCEALKMELPLRGCIGYGSVIFDEEKHIFLGQPLIDCVRGEGVQDWLGVSFSSNTLDSVSTNPKGGYKYTDVKQIFPLPIPNYQVKGKDEKEQEENGKLLSPFVLDWARYWRENNLGDIEAMFVKMNTSKKAAIYYDKALDFYKTSEKLEKWYELPFWKDKFDNM